MNKTKRVPRQDTQEKFVGHAQYKYQCKGSKTANPGMSHNERQQETGSKNCPPQRNKSHVKQK